MIQNPILQEAYNHDWYFPPSLGKEITSHKLYENALSESWHEWVETPLDFEAMKNGYVFDQSLDVDGKPVYWIDGSWQTFSGAKVQVEDEYEAIGHVGRGDHMMRFAETFLYHTKAPIEGDPYRFLPWMRKIVAPLYGWVHKDTRNRRYQNLYVAIAKKNGKLLASDTAIPTPSGWTNHGDLEVGDEVFDAKGDVGSVIAVHPDDVADYEVEFTNGERIKCNGDHLWVTTRLNHRGYSEPEVRETRDIAATLRTSQGALRHRVTMPRGMSDVRYVHIKSVRRITPVRGNCITVSSDDGTYLCGKTMVPTHNSALMSVLANYMLVADGTPKAQVYSCACDRNQARIIYDEAAHYVRGSGRLSDMVSIKDSVSRLVHQDSGSFYSVLSADAHRNDGLDSSCTLIDEIHRHPNRKLYAVMERAGLARPEPLMATITTYGPSLSDGSIWAEIHNEAKAQMEGDRPNSWRNMAFIASSEPIQVTAVEGVSKGATRIPVHRLEQPVDQSEIGFTLSKASDGEKVQVKITSPAKRFQTYIDVEPIQQDIPRFSEATANEDWRSEHSVRRSNPSAGVVFSVDRVLAKAEESRSPEKEAETKQLNFNIVSGSGKKWLSSAAWLSNKHQVQPKKLIGRHCYGGLDFSFGGDLVGFGLAFPSWDPDTQFIDVDNPRIDLLTFAWLPDHLIEVREKKERFPYRYYAEKPYLLDSKGCVRLCKGAVTDFPQVVDDVLEILENFELIAMAYDPNYASFGIPKIEEKGYRCVSHRQGAVSMSPPCKRFQELVYKGQLAHGENPLLSRAVEGAQLHPPDKAGNTYLSKGNSTNRIDVLVAQVMAVGFACDPPIGFSGAYADASSGIWG